MKNLHPSIVVIDRPGMAFPAFKVTKKHRGYFTSADLAEFDFTTNYVEEISDELWEEDFESTRPLKSIAIHSDQSITFQDFNPTW